MGKKEEREKKEEEQDCKSHDSNRRPGIHSMILIHKPMSMSMKWPWHANISYCGVKDDFKTVLEILGLKET